MGAAFVPQGGSPLLLARILFVTSLLSLGGTLVFRGAVLPHALARAAHHDAARARRALAGLIAASLVLAFSSLCAWTILQTGQLVGADRIGETFASLGRVLADTQFGHVAAVQCILLAIVAVLFLSGMATLAMLPALACVAAQAGHGHGAAARGLFGPLAEVESVHLLAASIWIGGLLPLLLVVLLTPPKTAAAAARWFSPIGKWAVAVLAAAALLQAAWLVGSVRAVRVTAYGNMIVVKAALFGVLLGMAVLNRYRLAPQLLRTEPRRVQRILTATIAVQTLVGVAAVTAASILSGLSPGLDGP